MRRRTRPHTWATNRGHSGDRRPRHPTCTKAPVPASFQENGRLPLRRKPYEKAAGARRTILDTSPVFHSTSKRLHSGDNSAQALSRSSMSTSSGTSNALSRRDHTKQSGGNAECDSPTPGAVPTMRKRYFDARPSLTLAINDDAHAPNALSFARTTPALRTTGLPRTPVSSAPDTPTRTTTTPPSP